MVTPHANVYSTWWLIPREDAYWCVSTRILRENALPCMDTHMLRQGPLLTDTHTNTEPRHTLFHE
eukprot:15541-Eustigmatos_ZCMA.PRE.1